ncbi:MAG: hypothetical protein LBQ66_16085 [Planctomycetaceae bacterium]|nr:hypothetical protein [Planctomycetaceae bacterium]
MNMKLIVWASCGAIFAVIVTAIVATVAGSMEGESAWATEKGMAEMVTGLKNAAMGGALFGAVASLFSKRPPKQSK